MAGFEINETTTRVIDLIAGELGINSQDITPEKTFSDLGADSLDIVEIIMKLEEQFGIEIKDEDAEQMKTVKAVIAYVQAHRTK